MRYVMLLLCLAVFILPTSPSQAAGESDDALFNSLNQAPVVLIGVIEKVTAGPVGLSSPPLRTYTIKIAPMARVLRGKFKGDEILAYSYRGDDEPKLEEGKEYIIALNDAGSRPRLRGPGAIGPGIAVPLPATIEPLPGAAPGSPPRRALPDATPGTGTAPAIIPKDSKPVPGPASPRTDRLKSSSIELRAVAPAIMLAETDATPDPAAKPIPADPKAAEPKPAAPAVLGRRAFPGGPGIAPGIAGAGGRATISAIVPATPEARKIAEMAVKAPIGWKFAEGKLISPWKAWGMDSTLTELPKGEMACSATGRPALLAGEGIQIASEQVMAKERQEYKNPFGDGQFKITVTNTGAMATEVPALLTDGTNIRWDYSLVIISGNDAKVLPRGEKPAKLTPVKLEPGASVTGVVDTLLLDGISWPRGGSRVQFTFALGETATGNFFYYFSDLHDKIRASRLKK